MVIELKRKTDGGHLELQALRYADLVIPGSFRAADWLITRRTEHTSDRCDPHTKSLRAVVPARRAADFAMQDH